MCNANCIIFGVKDLDRNEVEGKKIIEVGSYDLNGSLRPIIKDCKPAEYIGVDREEGPGVDKVCKVEDIINEFGKESFDVVIATELLEHIYDWRKAISNLKNVCRTGGIILITTRSFGFAYHAHPFDFWRYEINDMKEIFSDFKILNLQTDPQDPGVFLKARKPSHFNEKDLSSYKLYSIIANKRIKEIRKKDLRSFNYLKLCFLDKIKRIIKNIKL